VSACAIRSATRRVPHRLGRRRNGSGSRSSRRASTTDVVLRFEQDGESLYPQAVEASRPRPSCSASPGEIYRRFGYFPTESSENGEYVPVHAHDDQSTGFASSSALPGAVRGNLRALEALQRAWTGDPLELADAEELASLLIHALGRHRSANLHVNIRKTEADSQPAQRV